MQDIIAFLEEYWIYLALVAGAILILVVASFVIGRTGRISVTRPAKASAKPDDTPASASPTVGSTTVETALPDDATAPAVPEVDVASASKTSPAPIVETAADPIPEPAPVPAADPVAAETGPATVAAEPTDTPDVAPREATEPDPIPAKPKTPKPILGAYHVLYRADGDQWIVRRDGSDRIQRSLSTQAEAVNWATIKALTQNVELVVHKKDGSIRKSPSK